MSKSHYSQIRTSKKLKWCKQSTRGGYASDSRLNFGRDGRISEDEEVPDREQFKPRTILIKGEQEE